jgi:cardiolipin synthase (CMP-forming)
VRRWLRRVCWIASGPDADPSVAFDWISGRVGSRQNPDGMRSLLHAGAALAALCAAIDWAVLQTHGRAQWALFAFLHLAWVGVILVATVLNVGFLETPEGASLRRVGGPNAITLARGFLIPALVYLILVRDFRAATVGYAVVTLSDVVDGAWARLRGPRSKLGIVLDPVVDLFLHLAVFVSLVAVGCLGGAALILILARSSLLVLGTAWLYWRKGCVRIQPTPLGKGTGLGMTLGTTALLALSGFAPGAASWIAALRAILVVLLALSVAHALAIGIINLSRPAIADRGRAGGLPPTGDRA